MKKVTNKTMTPQFTTACYIKIDCPQQRKEVCDKLEQIGYKNIAIKDNEWILTKCESTNVEWLIEYIKTAIECFDIPTFLDLAAMRSDNNDYMQLFTDGENIIRCYGIDLLKEDYTPSDLEEIKNYRKATAQEIIEWHKKKEKL